MRPLITLPVWDRTQGAGTFHPLLPVFYPQPSLSAFCGIESNADKKEHEPGDLFLVLLCHLPALDVGQVY